MTSSITIVGAGITGLTTAVQLQEGGFDVRIIAREPPMKTTSAVAAAVWFPYKAYPRQHVIEWGRHSLNCHRTLADQSHTGVSMVDFVDHRETPPPEPWWAATGVEYRRAEPHELRPDYQGGFVLRIPLIEASIHLSYLVDRFTQAGGTLDILPDGLSSLDRLAGTIVNCSGLGARKLAADDSVYPIRGQVLRVSNPGITRCTVDDQGPRAVSYVIPRSCDCILGGTADEDNWSLHPEETSTRRILEHCLHLEPGLKDAELLDVKVGLRPARPAIRLEKDILPGGQAVIHNYGHGGSGYTLAWGCAHEVARLITAHHIS